MSRILPCLVAVMVLLVGMAGWDHTSAQPLESGPRRPGASPARAGRPARVASPSPTARPSLGRPPVLVTTEGSEETLKLGVSRVDVEVRILGYLAETRMTMVFSNPFGRPLGGDLYFPLPEGATVSGYALDVQGAMVDGVVVDKEKARRVLETEMRRGVDPGIAEMAVGNVFKTRVFPIPARGTRTVSVSWTAGIEGTAKRMSYRLPLMFKDKLSELHVRVEVVKGQAQPQVTSGGIPGLEFGRWRDSFVAEARVKDQAFTEDLVVVLPDVEKAPLQVEQGPDGAVYFVVDDTVVDTRGKPPATSHLSKATIFWDASGSRSKTDHEREFSLLRAFFARHKAFPVEVSLVVFRVAPEPAQRFTVTRGDAGKLLAALARVPYDGATQVGRLPVPASTDGGTCLLFTDGLTNFGQDVPNGLKAPLHILSADTQANYPFLHLLASRSGGTCFNLGRLSNEQVLAGLEAQPWSFLKVTTEGGQVETWPKGSRPIQGRFTLAGRLQGDEARVTLHYGAGGREFKHTEYRVRRSDGVPGSMLRRFWAAQKIAELSALYERNEATIVALGKKHGLVTPGTSLIVLETLDQYVAHSIQPPASLPDMQKAYQVAMEGKRRAGKEEETAKIHHVLEMWQGRVAWWNTKVTYPVHLKVPTDGREDDRQGVPNDGRSGSAGSGVHPGPRPADPPASRPTERDMATNAPRPVGGADSIGSSSSARPVVAGKQSPEGGEQSREATIVIQQWNPATPYLKALQAAPREKRVEVYLAHKKQYGKGPGFFLDCADFFSRQRQDDLALQVLSNIAEMDLENAAMLRVLAHRLEQMERLDLAIDIFERARRMRMEEPQSHRDLALVLAKRARKTGSVADYQRSMELLDHVVMNRWERFDEIEIIALEELNAVWAEFCRRHPQLASKPPCDARLVKLLDVDIRILLNWDADMTDMDLHVVEPSGERAYYGHNRTRIGGLVSRDFTQGYGPEEYMVRRAMHGKYRIMVNYFGSSAVTLLGPVTVQAEVITDFGRPTEKRKSLTLRLTGSKDTEKVGEIEL